MKTTPTIIMSTAISTILILAALFLAGCDSYVNQTYSGDLPDVTKQRDWSELEPAATPTPAPRPETRPVEMPPDDPAPVLAEYIKIVPAEAYAMIEQGDVLVLDVRSEDEYDTGYIATAICLPAPSLADNVAQFADDSDMPIIVYCQTGVRSEAAARELIELGYTRVYDLGGIEDWPYEIYLADTDYVYYNYYGGDLPDAAEVRFDYTTTMRVHDSLPELGVRVEGVRQDEYGLSYTDESKYFRRTAFCEVTKVTVFAEDVPLYQELSDLGTGNSFVSEYNKYGLVFDDWNFDGYQDLALWRYPGGSSGNNPHYYWLWDNEAMMFVENALLMEISDYAGITVNTDTRQLEAYSNFGAFNYTVYYIEYRDGEFVVVHSEEIETN
jgi:rhodanese-related sulfurtransferase